MTARALLLPLLPVLAVLASGCDLGALLARAQQAEASGQSSTSGTSPGEGSITAELWPAGTLTLDPASPLTADAPQAALPTGEKPAEVEVDPVIRVEPEPPLVTDLCDDEVYAGVEWVEQAHGPLTLRFLPGTAAERDAQSLAADRLRAIDEGVAFFGLTQLAPIKVVLSPSRAAARHHGLGLGVAYLSANRIEAIYTGAPDGYEKVRFGHEITHLVSQQADPRYHLPLLSEGIAEYLDGSGRDHHADYARELLARPGAPITHLEDTDVRARNYARSGSLVRLLVERYGRERFVELWKAAAVTWSGSRYTLLDGTPVNDGVQLEAALDKLLRAVYGFGYAELAAEWQQAIAPHLARGPAALADAELAAIARLVREVDLAIGTQDPVRYRSTLEGYYCDSWTDAAKARKVVQATELRGEAQTRILSVHPIGVRNGTEVTVYAARRESRGGVWVDTSLQLWFEHLPVGWRLTWASAW